MATPIRAGAISIPQWKPDPTFGLRSTKWYNVACFGATLLQTTIVNFDIPCDNLF